MVDEHDARLIEQVHPSNWRNPAPAHKYDLVVIGGGTAGLVCAAGAAGLGARVALVERSLLGGDCLNTGCVPSKALLRSARAVGDARTAARVGVTADARPDFRAVMRRLRARRADLAPNDSAQRLSAVGADVFFGSAAFTSPQTVDVDGTKLVFRKAVIATGSRPAIPPVPGLGDVPFFTNENLFSIEEQPRELIVLGAGPVGCEIAQAFARLGTRVTLFETAAQVLPREDRDAAAMVKARLGSDGVDVRTGINVTAAAIDNGRVRVEHAGGSTSADAVLVATGRAPRVEDLSLGRADVGTSTDGVLVDDHLRTTNRNIHAAGDVCSRYKFTHAADAMARIAVQNALFFGRRRVSSLVIPWCTFTEPEVAHVGPEVAECAERHLSTLTVPFSEVDRAVIDESEGFVRIHHEHGKIVAATVVGPNAGELIGMIANAIRHGRRVADFSAAIFPYPTLSLALRQAGDASRRAGLTPPVRTLLRYYFSVFR